MKNTALRPGYAVQVLPTKYVGPNKATMPECMREYDAKIETDSINAALDELEKMAYSAGFRMSVKSVTLQGRDWVILYRLEDDPSFHPPM